ncbi:Hypothetical_protein [Hexamita inflata]|uniref:Hypothetical_protein n=1 Tax=Hexamita inflata TaxID=28002 RepID=A0AA86UIP8_9EUKA|nr:Hypothetical protein HINF_LOCUS44969 [Hexamita inflata]
MAVYSTTQMPSLVIVSVSLSCNVYFNSVRELELVVDVHEHLVSRGSFEAEVLVVGVIDDVLDQLSDRLSLEGCRRLKVWSLRQLFSMMVRVCPLPYFCLSSSEVPCGSSESQSVSSSFMSWFVLVRLHAIGVFSECFAMYFTFVEMLLLVWESNPVERSSMMMSVVSEFIDSRQPLYLFIFKCHCNNICFYIFFRLAAQQQTYVMYSFINSIGKKWYILILLFIEYYTQLKILSLQRIQYTKVFNQFLLNYCCLSSITHN